MEQIIANDSDIKTCNKCGSTNIARKSFNSGKNEYEIMEICCKECGSLLWERKMEPDTQNAPSLTVRNIPPETHRKLKIIAVKSGLSMQSIILALIDDFVEGHERRKK